MNAKISAQGLLSIKAETEIEAYALRQWMKTNSESLEDCPNLLIDGSLPEEEGNDEHKRTG